MEGHAHPITFIAGSVLWKFMVMANEFTISEMPLFVRGIPQRREVTVTHSDEEEGYENNNKWVMLRNA
jgi:hypothetical protein